MPLEGQGDVPAGARSSQRVFVEIGTSDDPTASGQIHVARENSPEVPTEGWRVAHVVAREDRPATIPWHFDQGELPDAALGELTVHPHLSDVPPGAVRLDIALRDTADGGARVESERGIPSAVVETSLMLRDQQTVVLRTQASAFRPSQILLVTPYVIRHDGDLQRLLQCKLQARADAVGER
jgi:hypothetical protein